ncbi:MAG: DUF4133 domain-containing protein [Agriterribacter sp.]
MINKGVNAPIVFKGLQAQYIWWLGAGLVGLLLLFALLYLSGLSSIVCVAVTFISGFILVFKIYRLSAKYGQHGLTKLRAWRMLPRFIRNHSRFVFIK